MAVIKAQEYKACIPARDVDGNLIECAPSVYISKDGGPFVDTTNMSLAISNYGFSVVLTSTEMDASVIIVKAESSGTYIPVLSLSTDTEIQVSVDAELVANELLSSLSLYEGLTLGPGFGSIKYEDILVNHHNVAIAEALIRAYYIDPDTSQIDWHNCKGSYISEADGAYHLNLDPGTYARRVWKNGIVILDDLLIVTA